MHSNQRTFLGLFMLCSASRATVGSSPNGRFHRLQRSLHALRRIALVATGVLVSTETLDAGMFTVRHPLSAYDSVQSSPHSYEAAGSVPIGASSRVHYDVSAFVDVGRMGIADHIRTVGFVSQAFLTTTTFEFDVVFSSLTDAPIDVQMQLDLSGRFLAGRSGIAVAVATGTQGSGGGMTGDLDRNTLSATGILNGQFTPDGTTYTITTDIFHLQTNQAVPFRLVLESRMNPGTSTLDFSNTFGLTTNGDVFEIINGPGDVSVDSADANIVDNRYSAPGANQVPEPSSMVLLGIGTLGLLSCGRPRRKRPAKQPSIAETSLP